MTRTRALLVAVILLAVAIAFDRTLALRGYLIGWLLALGVSGGATCWLMIHNLTGGRWGYAIRRPAAAAARAMPVVALAFVPIALGARVLFPWADAALVEASHALQHRRVAFTTPLVIGRSVLFLAVWSVLAWSVARAAPARAGRLSAAGLVIYFVTMSLASIDWIASREPDWYSSTFGFVTILGQAATALAFLLTVVGRPAAAADAPAADVAHDLGNLLQTSVVLWAYVSFAQYLVIWSGNSQEDIVWFVHRTQGAWLAAGVALIVGHFGLPFVLLLFQPAKRNVRILGSIAVFVLVMRFVDTLWTIVPSSPTDVASRIRVADVLVPAAMAALWGTVFAWQLAREPAPAGPQDTSIEGADGIAA